MPDNILRRCSLELLLKKKKKDYLLQGELGAVLSIQTEGEGCLFWGRSAMEALTPRSLSPFMVFLQSVLAGASTASQSTIPNWYCNIRRCWSTPSLPSCEKPQSPCWLAETGAARIFLPYGLLNRCSIKLPSFIKWLAERTNVPCSKCECILHTHGSKAWGESPANLLRGKQTWQMWIFTDRLWSFKLGCFYFQFQFLKEQYFIQVSRSQSAHWAIYTKDCQLKIPQTHGKGEEEILSWLH